MEKIQVQLAMRIPEALIEDIDQFAAQHQAECTIESKVVSPGKSQGEEELGFDPITGSAIMWVALKFLGGAAVSVALNLLASKIYEGLKTRAQRGQVFEVIVRFPTGESITLRSDKPMNLKELEELINRSVGI